MIIECFGEHPTAGPTDYTGDYARYVAQRGVEMAGARPEWRARQAFPAGRGGEGGGATRGGLFHQSIDVWRKGVISKGLLVRQDRGST